MGAALWWMGSSGELLLSELKGRFWWLRGDLRSVEEELEWGGEGSGGSWKFWRFQTEMGVQVFVVKCEDWGS